MRNHISEGKAPERRSKENPGKEPGSGGEMNQFDISVTIAVIMDGLLGIAYLGFSAFLLSFKEFPYTICGILVFLYVLTSFGNVTGSLGSVFNTGVGKKDS